MSGTGRGMSKVRRGQCTQRPTENVPAWERDDVALSQAASPFGDGIYAGNIAGRNSNQGGQLPNLARLIKERAWCENCLVPHPAITPPKTAI